MTTLGWPDAGATPVDQDIPAPARGRTPGGKRQAPHSFSVGSGNVGHPYVTFGRLGIAMAVAAALPVMAMADEVKTTPAVVARAQAAAADGYVAVDGAGDGSDDAYVEPGTQGV